MKSNNIIQNARAINVIDKRCDPYSIMRLGATLFANWGIMIAAIIQPIPNINIVIGKEISPNSKDDLTSIIVFTSIMDPPADTAKFKNINPFKSDILRYFLIPSVILIEKLFSFRLNFADTKENRMLDINNAETTYPIKVPINNKL